MTDTPTIYTDDSAALVRHVLTGTAGIILASGATWLVAHGWIASAQSAQFVAVALSVVTFAATVAWSWYQKHTAKQLQLVALVAPKGTTELQAIATVAIGIGVPSVLTPPTVVPKAATP